ncbi:MAG: N-acetylmuramic acid 6-phosphate etherase [Rhodospirillales bacterium]|jgi:N-acetylmuramic acid 6-phosphate etherase|nr:N-acetylmuramic acid 6-phosphate etherase [Rhodospirillales bacterium]
MSTPLPPVDRTDLETAALRTEQRNPATIDLDLLDTAGILAKINEQDRTVPAKVAVAIPAITRAVDLIVERMERGGRLIYAGAGTSGRIGVLDASECPPTFGVSPQTVVGLIAGGPQAVFGEIPMAEDDGASARRDLAAIQLSANDTVMALAASGRTPYCAGALAYAAEIGAGRVSLACNPGAKISALAEVAIEVDTGPEALQGSTRMKAGTAEKLVVNMVTTTTMIRLGHVYSNMMASMKANNRCNSKIYERRLRVFQEVTGCADRAEAVRIFEQAGTTRCAIVMQMAGVSAEQAEQALCQANQAVRKAIAIAQGMN